MSDEIGILLRPSAMWPNVNKTKKAGQQKKANAALIAAAPDMYDTLVKVERYLVTQGKETDELWCEVKAVIAKVRGK